MKRRWTIPATRHPDGTPTWLVVAVPPDDGTILTQVGDSHLRFLPEDLSRLRRVFQEAQAVALHDRGDW